MTEATATCDNCTKQWPIDDLEPYQNFWSRVDVGGIVPAGDCPECGAFAYLDDPDRLPQPNRAMLVEIEALATLGLAEQHEVGVITGDFDEESYVRADQALDAFRKWSGINADLVEG